MKYRIAVPPHVEAFISSLPPLLKSKIRAGLEVLQEDPHAGKPLKEELRGLWSYRVSRYRIIYRIDHHRIEVQIIEVGSRAIIYEKVLLWARRLKG